MNYQQDLQLARALYQLTIYLESLRLPLTVQSLYWITYGELWREMPGALLLDFLEKDPNVTAVRDESFTLGATLQTLKQAGLGLLLEVLEEETKQHGIGMGVWSHSPRNNE